MTDYHPLIARAVDGLAKNTGEARRALYERARAALVAQLRAVEPALAESDITKERLALEDAIRKVESEAARKALAEPRAQLRAETRRPEPAKPAQQDEAEADVEAPRAPIKQSARSRILEARTSSTSSISQHGLKGFRNVVNEVDGLGTATAKAAQTARDTRDSYAPASRERSPQGGGFPASPSLRDRIEPRFEEEEELPPPEDESLQSQDFEPSYDLEDEDPGQPPHSARPQPPRVTEYDDQEEEEYGETRPPRSYRSWVKNAVLLIIALGLAGTAWSYRSNIARIYYRVSHMQSRSSTQTEQTQAPQTKSTERVPQEQVPGQAPLAGANPSTQQGPEVAQRAVLYEADPNDPQGKRFAGSVIWRTETVSPGPGLAPELAVRADVSIPERHMTVTFSLRRNTDQALPASHTIEIMFNLPPDFPGGGISNVVGIIPKKTEEVPGTPLAASSVKVTDTYFLIGLSSDPTLQQRNLQLLKDQEWFDIPIVYKSGEKALLAIERGPPGDRAFADAFAAWGQ